MKRSSAPSSLYARPLLLLGVLLIAANLRAPITGVAPLLDMIRDGLSLSAAEAGGLTALPLLAFAVASPFCVLLAREYGLERCLFAALLLIAGGVGLRAAGSTPALFGGSLAIGLGIAVANVLLPSLLKRDCPDRIAGLTSAYALTAGAAAALASAFAVPIATLPGSSWNWALLAFLPVTLTALAVWAPQLRASTPPTADVPTPPHGDSVWRAPLAWQVTAFFGLNSLVYYVVVAWLPAILAEAGYSAAAAGSLHGVSQLATAVPGLFLGLLVARMKDQRLIAALTPLATVAAMLGLIVAPGLAVVWAALFGFGTGATFILALAFVSLRASSAGQAAALSGMAQSVGYVVASVAPSLVGVLHETTGGWRLPLLLCAAVGLLMAGFGFRAGRAVQIG
ncbi:MFS transporter [Brevundimonas faecalis]|uniref:CP family cyanate transporter-like MFS transporter n=1 Tax=Brevundimonas faecalis TaxID=947378 RepID=A0ABV2R9R2_9CAUL